MTWDAAELLAKMTWLDNNHLQIGDTRFQLTLDGAIWETAESTPDQFLLLKNWWLVQSALKYLPQSVHNMVEIGIFKGGSIALYEELYSPTRLVGVDLESERVTVLDQYLERRSASERVRLYYGTDQQDREALRSIALENFGHQPLDLVVDDGSHRYEPSKASLNVLLPRLRPGGVYLLEDWAWAHWARCTSIPGESLPRVNTPIKRAH